MGQQLNDIASETRLLRSWREVTAFTGDRTFSTPEIANFESNIATNISTLARSILDGTWRPGALRRTVIATGDKRRTLMVPGWVDRAVERAVLDVLDPLVDIRLVPTVFGFRRGLGVTDALDHLSSLHEDGVTDVLRVDIKDCYDTILHSSVLTQLTAFGTESDVLDLVRLLLPRTDWITPDRGLPQGSPLSPLLCNAALADLDMALLREGHSMVRYADDMCIPLTHPGTGVEVAEVVSRLLLERGLSLNSDRTRVESFATGVHFLGQVVSTSRAGAIDHPSVASVYVAEQGSIVRSKGKRLLVDMRNERKVSVPYSKIRHVSIFGRVGMTTPALQQLMRHGVGVTLMSDTGSYIGRLEGDLSTNPFLRRSQYEKASDPAWALDIAREILVGKILNQRSFVVKIGHRRGVDVATVESRLAKSAEGVASASSIAEMLGHEGIAAREYFAVLGAVFGDRWQFSSRRRRPPPDPVNSMLSFGYTMLVQEGISALHAAGLDPYMGVVHRPKIGRPSLALDLIEQFRAPVVDSMVVTMVARRQVTPEGFIVTSSERPNCRMTRETRCVFLDAYEKRMLTLHKPRESERRLSWRESLFEQAAAVADMFGGRREKYPVVRWR